MPLGEVVERVRALAAPLGARPLEAELVGLIPAAALAGYPGRRADPRLRPRRSRRSSARLAAALSGSGARFSAMAQTKKKRRRKHRGTQGGRIDTNRRARARAAARRRRPAPAPAASRRPAKPTARRPGAARSSAASSRRSIFTALLMLIFKRPLGVALGLGAFMLVFYIPAGYYIDTMMWRRRERARIRDTRKRE